MITGYRNDSGDHCGSSAMRNLLWHYCDLDLSEAAVFGLGSGIDCIVLEGGWSDPAVVVFGRGLTMEADAASALGIDYREQPELDDERAWQLVREEVAAGRPTMLSGDVFYLDYREFKVHFPAHRFVLLGFDDDKKQAFVADRIACEPQVASYAALRASRNPPDFISTYNAWGKFHDTAVKRSMAEAFTYAIRRSAARMLGHDRSQEQLVKLAAGKGKIQVAAGLAGIVELQRQVASWADRPDAEKIARYAADCIEKYGTGGGNFRTLYANFLQEARALVPDVVHDVAVELAVNASVGWTKLSTYLGDANWIGSTDALAEILELETKLFESLSPPSKTTRG